MGQHSLFLAGLAIILCSGCGEKTPPSPESMPAQAEPPLVLTTLSGTHLETGIPQHLEGRILPAEQIQVTRREVSGLHYFPEPLIQPQTWPVQKIAPYTTEIREISFGKGNFPPLETLPVGPPQKHRFEPVITRALPFQNQIHEKLSYRNLGISQGLSSAQVTSIFQDSRDYFWFGGKRGLTRYDGYSFHYYQFVSDDQQREIGAITEDAQGNLWMTFSSWGGLMMFDGVDFYEYKEGDALHVGETYLGIIHVDQRGNIWLKSETKIIRFDGKTFTCFPYQFQNLKNLNILMKENAQGGLWLSALGGVCRIDGDEMRYYALEEYAENNLCNPILEDERGLIVATGTGITVLKNDTLRVFPCEFMRNHEIRNTLSTGSNFLLATKDKRNALCALNDSVLTIFSGNAPLFQGAHLMLADRFNKIWFSIPGEGVQVYNTNGFKHFTFENMHGGGHISSILQDENGSMWFGSHGFGLYNYDGKNHRYFPLTTFSTELAVRALVQDDAGNIWAGTVDSGLFKIENPHSDAPVILRYNCFGDTVHSIFSLTLDHHQHLWIGTRTHGVLRFDGKNFTNYRLAESEPINSPNNIRALLTDQKGNVWMGAQNGGLCKFDGTTFTWYTTHEGLSSNHVVSLMEDHAGNLWIGTSDQGVNKMTGNTFVHITMADGLTSNAIWTITEDNGQNVWLGADNTLNVILRATDETSALEPITVKVYRNMDGLEGAEFYANSGIKDQQGRLWWGTEQMALMISDPVSLVDQGQVKLALEGITLVNNRIDFKQLQDSIKMGNDWLIPVEGEELNLAKISFDAVSPFSNCPAGLELPAYLNDISFSYTVSGPSDLADLEFSYFMEGVDKDWSIPTQNNQVDYRGLAPGTYTLQTKVAEVKGVWNEPVSYTFTILPFWWQTWWAYLLWFSIFAGILVVIFRLISMRRKEREDTRRIREIESMKSQFYANITHEFRTPLTLIMGMTNEINGHEKQREIIQRNSEKLLLQINQLLDTAKLESGNLTLNLLQKDIVPYLRFLTESFFNLAQDRNVQLTFYSEEASLLMDYDEEKMQGIIYNLLSNAIKFTPAGGKVVFHVSVLRQKNQLFLRLKIADTGIGIPPDQLEKIYQRFYQVPQKKPGAQGGGTGIGLALTKDLVTLMHGTIQAQSTVNAGTEFTVVLPVTNQATVVAHSTFQTLPGASARQTEYTYSDTAEADPDALNILIIEDNKEISNYLADILRPHYQVYTAENGLTGLNRAFELIPDAVISDIAMPEKNGYEVCEHLKKDERTSHIPVILLTAKVTQKDKLEGLKQGADAYLTKPFHREELEITLQKLIALRRKLQKRYATLLIEPEAIAAAEKSVPQPADTLVIKLTELINKNLGDSDFGVPQLVEQSGLSQMQLYRKLKAITNKTPSQFIRTCRLQKALDLLRNTQLNISEIAYEVGFSDPNYFSRTFHQEFGCPPAQIRK